MSSTFDSFNSSALGARVQSSVDDDVFGGGLFGVVEVTSIALDTLAYWEVGGEIIKNSAGVSFWTRYRAPLSDETVQYLSITFRSEGGLFAPIFDAGAWQIPASGVETVQSVKVTGRDSGTVLTIPAFSYSSSATGTFLDTGNLRALSSSFPVPDVATFFGAADITLFTYLYNVPTGSPLAIPADVDFDVGEFCDVELL